MITLDKRVVATGYNGSIVGQPHCDDVGCLMISGHCERTIHAEMNSICQAARYGIAIQGATVYITCSPCWVCTKLLLNAGVKRLVFAGSYSDSRFIDAAKLAGVEIVSRPDLAEEIDKGTTGAAHA